MNLEQNPPRIGRNAALNKTQLAAAGSTATLAADNGAIASAREFPENHIAPRTISAVSTRLATGNSLSNRSAANHT